MTNLDDRIFLIDGVYGGLTKKELFALVFIMKLSPRDASLSSVGEMAWAAVYGAEQLALALNNKDKAE